MKITTIICTIFYLLYGSIAFSENLNFKNNDLQNKFIIPNKIPLLNKDCSKDDTVGYRKGPILLGEINQLLSLISKQHGIKTKSIVAKKISTEMSVKLLNEAGGNAHDSDRGKVLLSSLKSDKYSQSILLKGTTVNYLIVSYTKTFQERLGVVFPGIVINLNNGLTEATFKHKMGYKKGSGALCNGCYPSPNDACVACSSASSSPNKLDNKELWTYPTNEILPLPLSP